MEGQQHFQGSWFRVQGLGVWGAAAETLVTASPPSAQVKLSKLTWTAAGPRSRGRVSF